MSKTDTQETTTTSTTDDNTSLVMPTIETMSSFTSVIEALVDTSILRGDDDSADIDLSDVHVFVIDRAVPGHRVFMLHSTPTDTDNLYLQDVSVALIGDLEIYIFGGKFGVYLEAYKQGNTPLLTDELADDAVLAGAYFTQAERLTQLLEDLGVKDEMGKLTFDGAITGVVVALAAMTTQATASDELTIFPKLHPMPVQVTAKSATVTPYTVGDDGTTLVLYSIPPATASTDVMLGGKSPRLDSSEPLCSEYGSFGLVAGLALTSKILDEVYGKTTKGAPIPATAFDTTIGLALLDQARKAHVFGGLMLDNLEQAFSEETMYANTCKGGNVVLDNKVLLSAHAGVRITTVDFGESDVPMAIAIPQHLTDDAVLKHVQGTVNLAYGEDKYVVVRETAQDNVWTFAGIRKINGQDTTTNIEVDLNAGTTDVNESTTGTDNTPSIAAWDIFVGDAQEVTGTLTDLHVASTAVDILAAAVTAGMIETADDWYVQVMDKVDGANNAARLYQAPATDDTTDNAS